MLPTNYFYKGVINLLELEETIKILYELNKKLQDLGESL